LLVGRQVNLHALRREHSHLFYGSQSWFIGEPFMLTKLPADAPATIPEVKPVAHWLRDGTSPARKLPLAITLASLYVQYPDDPIWSRYLWCADLDSQGQRIFVGDNGKGFEIHRHLRITARWGMAVWKDAA
jgi:catechol 2,3-dioxygenase-like lactoylglutathione lyase family enzyme